MTNFVIRKRHNNLIVDKKDKDRTPRIRIAPAPLAIVRAFFHVSENMYTMGPFAGLYKWNVAISSSLLHTDTPQRLKSNRTSDRYHDVD